MVGKPPFETSSLKETYSRIKRNEYYIPSKVGPVAQKLIVKMLRPDPSCRPTMHEIHQDEFFRSGYLPSTLPASALSMAPRFNPSASILESKAITAKDAHCIESKTGGQRRPLFELNHLQPATSKPGQVENRRRSHAMHVINGESHVMTNEEAKKHGLGDDEGEQIPSDFYLCDLLKQLVTCLTSKPTQVTSARPTINPGDN